MHHRPLVLICALVSFASPAPAATNDAAHLRQRLADCTSLTPGDTYEAGDATRLYISLPAEIYPPQHIREASNGATFGLISNASPPGRAGLALASKHCWSSYGQFDEIARCTKRTSCHATVSVLAKSGVPGIPDYTVTFAVIPF